MMSSSMLILRELLAQHPEATHAQLLDLYCAKLKEHPALIDQALEYCFDADMAEFQDLARDVGPKVFEKTPTNNCIKIQMTGVGKSENLPPR
jgi:hypothetical protein